MALALGLASVAAASSHDATEALDEVDGSGVTGMAMLTDNGDGTTTVSIELQGAPADGVHPAHYHTGQCGDNGAIVYPLTDVVNGKSETQIETTLEDLMSEELYLNVHLSKEEIGTIVACGDEIEMMAQMPDAGAGGLADTGSTLPALALGLVATVLAAGTFMFARARSI